MNHRLFQRGYFEIDPDLCFVLMPFAEEFQALYTDHIKPAVQRAGLKCMRADDIFSARPIVQDIWEYICKARLIIAELTGRNPNVFYEVGMSHTLDKDVIMITRSMDDVPFDLKHIRCIVYDDGQNGLKKLEESLHKTIENVIEERQTGLVVNQASGDVWVEGRHLEPDQLSPLEFELLAFLYSRAPQTCRPSDIFERVYREEATGAYAQKVYSLVGRLRKKIEPQPSQPRYILTVRSEGYSCNRQPGGF